MRYQKTILKLLPTLLTVIFFITSCSTEEMVDISSPQKQYSENWKNADVEIPSIEEVIQTARERSQEMKQRNINASRSSGGIVNGGFEDLDDSGIPVGWDPRVFFGGINGDPSQGWIFGSIDPNATNTDIYSAGMLHPELLAHSGTNGASAVGNQPTVQVLLSQPFTIPELSCPEASITLDFWIRWKNQVEQWVYAQQDLQVFVFDDENGVGFSANSENLPFYSGGGDILEANYEQRSFDLSVFAGKTVQVIVYNIATVGYLFTDLDDFCVNVVLCPDEALAALASDIEGIGS